MDTIRLMNMSFYGFHGVTAAEKETGRRFEVDCELKIDVAEPGQTDMLSDTVDYTAVYKSIEKIVAGKAYALTVSRSRGRWEGRPKGQIYGYTIRTDHWRYTEWGGGTYGVELYDHRTDPYEYTNLAAKSGQAGDVARLRKLLVEAKVRAGATRTR
ncbi:MAG: dihydroneopterin aldolase [candidate division Zixibacteria bacterium]|nr:dihydroneopterin aldolase [candidate division Zixibacteria bacterium]